MGIVRIVEAGTNRTMRSIPGVKIANPDPARKGSRLTLEQQLSRDQQFKGRPLAIESRDESHGLFRLSDVRSPLNNWRSVVEGVDSRGFNVQDLGIVTIPGTKLGIMRSGVTTKMLKQFLQISGYRLGDQESEFAAFLAGSTAEKGSIVSAYLANHTNENEAISFINPQTVGEAFLKWRSALEGRDYQFVTREAWNPAFKAGLVVVESYLSHEWAKEKGGLYLFAPIPKSSPYDRFNYLSCWYGHNPCPIEGRAGAGFRLVEKLKG